MRIEVCEKYMAHVADQWGHDPNVRAEIKLQLAIRIALKMRLVDVIDYVVESTATGETLIVASVLAERTGDEK